jgi:hypothetical protein
MEPEAVIEPPRSRLLLESDIVIVVAALLT